MGTVSQVRRIDCTDGLSAQTADAVRRAVQIGECIVLPTDTVYGIGADPFNPRAVQRLLEAKGRTRQSPPPVLIAAPEVLGALTGPLSAAVRAVTETHWPGALTIIVEQQGSLEMDLGDAVGTIAVRVPDHDLAREVLRCTGPLAVSSANRHQQPAATTCDDAIDQLGDAVGLYLDQGATPGPEPSTIIDFTRRPGGTVLRHGLIGVDRLRECLPDLHDPSGGSA